MAYRIGVTEPGWDDIGQILSQMGIEYQDIECDSIPETLHNLDVLFVNCSSESSGFDWEECSEQLRDFVSRGGCIYASDLASSLLESVFPGHITFDIDSAEPGRYDGRVVDEGLASMIGRSVKLEYDTVVYTVSRVSPSTKVYIQRGNDKVVCSFKHGGGDVVYTTFHNHKQTSEQEKELLRFLALKPLLTQTARSSKVELERGGYESKTQIYATTMFSQAKRYEFNAKQGEHAKFYVNWEGENNLELSVFRPNGGLFRSVSGSRPPLSIDVENADAGPWTYTVRSLGGRPTPFVSDVAVSTRLWSQESSVSSGLGRRRFCRFCGVEISLDARFCRSCGADFR